MTLEPIVRAENNERPVPALLETLKGKAQLLMDEHGRIDVPWGDVNRLVRGKFDAPIEGGPDILRAVYGTLENGRLVGEAGDSYILMATWDKEGNVRSKSIHVFGSATLDAESPHYADQAELFVKGEYKPVWMDEAEIRQHLKREYRPGEE